LIRREPSIRTDRKAPGGDLRGTDEASGCRWASEAEVAERANEAYAIRVLDAMHDERPAAIRQHDGRHVL
jgi:8-oxo-dGTP diphosphatase